MRESSPLATLSDGDLGELLLHPLAPPLALLLGRLGQAAEFVVVVVGLPVGRFALPWRLGVAPASRIDPVEVTPQSWQVAAPVGFQSRPEFFDLRGAGRNYCWRTGRRLVRGLVDGVLVGLVVRVTRCLRRGTGRAQCEADGKG